MRLDDRQAGIAVHEYGGFPDVAFDALQGGDSKSLGTARIRQCMATIPSQKGRPSPRCHACRAYVASGSISWGFIAIKSFYAFPTRGDRFFVSLDNDHRDRGADPQIRPSRPEYPPNFRH